MSTYYLKQIQSRAIPATGIVGVSGVWTNVTPAGITLDPDPNGSNSGNYGAQDVIVDPVRPQDVYAWACLQGCWKSTDYGGMFTKISPAGGPLDFGRPWGQAIDPNPLRNPATSPTLYAALGFSSVGDGIYQSTNGGVTWTLVFGTTQAAALSIPNSVSAAYAVDIDPSNSAHLIVSFHSNADFNGLVESSDSGATWRVHNPPTGFGASHYIFFVTSTIWLVVAEQNSGANGTWRTTTGGLVAGSPSTAAWAKVSDVEHPHGGSQLSRALGGTLTLPGMTGLWQSSDNGGTWTQVYSAQSEGCVTATGANIYAGYPGFGVAANAFLVRAPVSPGTSFASYASQPAGITWGPKRFAATTDGARSCVIGGMWLNGFWRYIE